MNPSSPLQLPQKTSPSSASFSQPNLLRQEGQRWEIFTQPVIQERMEDTSSNSTSATNLLGGFKQVSASQGTLHAIWGILLHLYTAFLLWNSRCHKEIPGDLPSLTRQFLPHLCKVTSLCDFISYPLFLFIKLIILSIPTLSTGTYRSQTNNVEWLYDRAPRLTEPVGTVGILRMESGCHLKMAAMKYWARHKMVGGSKLSILTQQQQLIQRRPFAF